MYEKSSHDKSRATTLQTLGFELVSWSGFVEHLLGNLRKLDRPWQNVFFVGSKPQSAKYMVVLEDGGYTNRTWPSKIDEQVIL